MTMTSLTRCIPHLRKSMLNIQFFFAGGNHEQIDQQQPSLGTVHL